ncbi:hypothetical protein AURDEDRAFT_169731 [Auricularia subglabra TFB-10046 SS5]|nr:hypothetical protein AURDEDRAFT_169731 [Auricularia subglabra TFB-10046 SS5]
MPVEVMLDILLPYLPLKDLLALASTSKDFANLIDDDTFWQRKLESEYSFTSRETARKTGWKVIYRGMHRPQVFVWGSFHAIDSKGRLYAWGVLDGESWGHRVIGFGASAEIAYLPTRLDFEARLKYVTCGRAHALAFDAAGQNEPL